MKFINVITSGDFIKVKSLHELIMEGWNREDRSPIIDGIHISKGDEHLFIDPNTANELGNVLRISKDIKGEYGELYFNAYCNGINYPYEDGNYVSLDKELIDQVLINGKWYNANDDLNKLL